MEAIRRDGGLEFLGPGVYTVGHDLDLE